MPAGGQGFPVKTLPRAPASASPPIEGPLLGTFFLCPRPRTGPSRYAHHSAQPHGDLQRSAKVFLRKVGGRRVDEYREGIHARLTQRSAKVPGVRSSTKSGHHVVVSHPETGGGPPLRQGPPGVAAPPGAAPHFGRLTRGGQPFVPGPPQGVREQVRGRLRTRLAGRFGGDRCRPMTAGGGRPAQPTRPRRHGPPDLPPSWSPTRPGAAAGPPGPPDVDDVGPPPRATTACTEFNSRDASSQRWPPRSFRKGVSGGAV